MDGSAQHIHYEVTVSDELRHLLGSRTAGAPRPPAPAVEPQVRPQSARADTEPRKGPFGTIRLRRDGHQPMTFRGVPVFRMDCADTGSPGSPESSAGEARIALYLTDDRSAIAEVVISPGEETGYRPVHRVQEICDADGFRAFLNASEPGRSLARPDPDAIPGDDDHGGIRDALQGRFRAMADAILPSTST